MNVGVNWQQFQYEGSVQFFESFKKLWKLKMPLSRTWKGLEKRSFSRLLWKSLDFCLEKF